MLHASLKGQPHINIYIRVINYAQAPFLGLLRSDLSIVMVPSRIPADDQRDRPINDPTNDRYIVM